MLRLFLLELFFENCLKDNKLQFKFMEKSQFSSETLWMKGLAE